MGRATTVDEYIDVLQGPAREQLEALRAVAQRAAPEAAEAIRWGSPAYLHPSGTILFVLSAHTKHANIVFTPSTKEAFVDELRNLETGKGSVKLPYGDPVPAELLTRMIHHRIREHVDDGVTWM